MRLSALFQDRVSAKYSNKKPLPATAGVFAFLFLVDQPG
jgi:hypothetical protein